VVTPERSWIQTAILKRAPSQYSLAQHKTAIVLSWSIVQTSENRHRNQPPHEDLRRKRRERANITSTQVSTAPTTSSQLTNLLRRTLISPRVFIQIQLMISLRIPPLTSRQKLRRNLPRPPPLLLHLLRDLLGRLLLLLVMVEDRAAVLRAGVAPLPVFGRGVVHFVEELEELVVCDLVRVEGYLERLGVLLIERP